MAVIIDSDVVVPPAQLRDGIDLARRSGAAVLPYTHFCLVNRRDTDRLLSRHDLPTSSQHATVRTNRWSGCIIVPRRAWDAVGGFDPRFVGWGGEDVAFVSALIGLQFVARIPGNAYHLWHPASAEKRITAQYVTNVMLEHRYVAALTALGTDGITLFDDPPSHSTRNALVRAERQLAHGLDAPDLSSWWPSMLELVEHEPLPGTPESSRDVAVVVHTDGRRDYIEHAITTFEQHAAGHITRRIIWDDSGDAAYQEWLVMMFPGWHVIGRGRRLGYAASMATLWRHLATLPEQWIFRIEDDFTFTRPFDLTRMADVLEQHDYLQQMALLRAPWYPEEVEAGSVLGVDPLSFTPVEQDGAQWVEHRTWWTANPSLFRRSLVTRHPWPITPASEHRYSRRVTRDPAARMAYWGDGSPWMHHVGEIKAGTGY